MSLKIIKYISEIFTTTCECGSKNFKIERVWNSDDYAWWEEDHYTCNDCSSEYVRSYRAQPFR